MVQALGSMKDEPPSLLVCRHDVQCVESFTYLEALIHSTCSSEPEICRRSAMTRTAMQSLVWRSTIASLTKLRLYNAYILPVMLYGSDCWMVKKADVQRTDALDQWCLWRILDIHWNDLVRNDVVCRMTQQPPLSSVVKSRRLCLDMSLKWMSWLTPIEICLCKCRITEKTSQGGHAPPGFEMFATISPHLAWSCQKPGRQLRTNLSGRC